MIKIIEIVFRLLVMITLGSIVLFGLLLCGLLLWNIKYVDLAVEFQEKIKQIIR